MCHHPAQAFFLRQNLPIEAQAGLEFAIFLPQLLSAEIIGPYLDGLGLSDFEFFPLLYKHQSR